MDDILHGRRILITRTRQQASALAASLMQLGAFPLVVPTIEIVPPCSFDALDTVLANADRYDWFLFTSANAVRAFAQRVRERGSGRFTARVACIGSATAQAIRTEDAFAIAHPLLMPPSAVAESFAEMLLPHVKHLLLNKSSATFALVCAETARGYLPEALTSAGANVTIAPAYRTVLPADSVALLQQALQDTSGAPEAITFTSSSTASNFVDLLAAAGLSMPPDLLRISVGPITSATLQQLDLPAHAEAETPTIPSLLAAMRGAFASHQQSR